MSHAACGQPVTVIFYLSPLTLIRVFETITELFSEKKIQSTGTYTNPLNAALWIFFRKTRSVMVPRFGFFFQNSRIRVNDSDSVTDSQNPGQPSTIHLLGLKIWLTLKSIDFNCRIISKHFSGYHDRICALKASKFYLTKQFWWPL